MELKIFEFYIYDIIIGRIINWSRPHEPERRRWREILSQQSLRPASILYIIRAAGVDCLMTRSLKEVEQAAENLASVRVSKSDDKPRVEEHQRSECFPGLHNETTEGLWTQRRRAILLPLRGVNVVFRPPTDFKRPRLLFKWASLRLKWAPVGMDCDWPGWTVPPNQWRTRQESVATWRHQS